MDHGLFSSDQTSDNVEEVEVIRADSTKLYQVLSTDSVASIARKHGTTPAEIISLNNLKKPYYIKPGDLIRVPNLYDEDGQIIKSMPNPERRSITIAPKKTEGK